MKFSAPVKAVALMLLLVATSASSQRSPTDTALVQALQGAWCNSDDGGKTCWGYDIFDKGKSRFCGRFPENGQVSAGTSTYSVDGARVCHVVTSVGGDGEQPLKVGKRLCFRVLSIDSQQQTFRDEAAGTDTRIYRMRVEDVRCPKAGV
jgi:hypothetical protein